MFIDGHLSINKIILILYCGLALTLVGCASTRETGLTPEIDSEAVVAEVTGLLAEADKLQADLLSFKEYRNGSARLTKAQQGLSAGNEPETILKNAALAKASFELALEQSRHRSANAPRILQARKAALGAGLKSSSELKASLADVDDELRDATRNFAEALEPDTFSEFQKRYFSLEVEAVQFRELDAVKKSIRNSSREGAEKLAPKTLRMASLDVNEAENIIAQSPRNPGIHGKSVTKAVESAVLLVDVLDVISNAKGTTEDIALRIVHQDREIVRLSRLVENLEQDLQATRSRLVQTKSALTIQTEKLQSTQSSLAETKSALQIQNEQLKTTESSLLKTEDELKTRTDALQSTRSNLLETESALILQHEELEKNSTRIRFQKAMDEAVKQFSEDEASVYQQGNNLIFRIKQINFQSGTSTIPAVSKPLLVKIDTIIRSLGTKVVAVQGHTDSVGAADLNQRLSTKRAISVANYLSTLTGGYKIDYIGYGESRPIATNETREGRAINRRVDLVVTATK